MAFVLCSGCGHVVSTSAACPHCPSSVGNFGKAVMLLGLTLTAGCPQKASSKYGVEPNDITPPADQTTDTSEPKDNPQVS